MSVIVPRLPQAVKDRLLRHLRSCHDPGLKVRYLIIVNLAAGRSPQRTADVLALHRATVYRVPTRYRDRGELGLFDRRRDNGPTKVDGLYREVLDRAVRSSPRPTAGRAPPGRGSCWCGPCVGRRG